MTTRQNGKQEKLPVGEPIELYFPSEIYFLKLNFMQLRHAAVGEARVLRPASSQAPRRSLSASGKHFYEACERAQR